MKGKILTTWSLIWLLATVLFVAGGALNLSQRGNHQLPPTDGADWTQKADGIYAEKVAPNLAASRAGIAVGDRLIGISLDEKQFDEVVAPSDVQMYLETAGVSGNLTYFYQRPSYSFTNNFYYADLRNIDTLPRWTASLIFLSIVGIIWLGVGIFVLFKQGSHSPFVLHFAAVCLTAFVFHVYKPIGLGEDFDDAIRLLDDMAFAFFVPLFLHFCLRYPVRSEVFDEPRWKTYLLYVPASLITIANFFVSLVPLLPLGKNISSALANFVDKYQFFPNLYSILNIHFVLGISFGASFLLWRFLKNRQQPLVRQRIKWAMWGTIVAVAPIVIFQIAKRFIPSLTEDYLTVALTTLPLALIPLSFGHSVVRYRLMDVDVVVRRALVYAMTTVAIAMMIGVVALGLVLLAVGDNLSVTDKTLRALIAIVAMAAIVLLSEPLKRFLQERAERFFYGERYDLRQGLLDFGRTLSATTALEPLLNALTERLRQVLDVEKVAVFIEDENLSEHYKIAKSIGISENYKMPNDFRQMIRQKSAEKGIVRADELELLEEEFIDEIPHEKSEAKGIRGKIEKFSRNGKNIYRQELHYFVPCVARGKMVAVLGLGRASDGSLLSSEDLEILQTVSGFVAVAVENSLLYQEQEKRAEELELLKEFNESIVESVNVGLIAVDEGGRITRCNSTFEAMLDISREQTIGKLVEEIFDEGFALNLENILGKSRWHLTEIRNAYKMLTTNRQGKTLVLNVAVAPLRSISNNQTGAIIVLENVTSRIKLEETLQQSEKLSSIGLLAAGVAHEVNTPLTGVSSYTQMLLGMIPETDPKHALLQKVQKQTDRASNIVGNLLNFSRTGNAAEFTEIDLNKLLDDTLQLLEPQLRKSQVEIVKNYAELPPKIFGNAGKLQQVFTNLIINARDAMFGGGEITLTTDFENEDEVVIEVTDTGSGIEPENLIKIYDPFFTTKGVGSGTGLGLAVSYGIVQEHAGTITATSEVGFGTTFRLVFPMAQKPQLQRAVS
ncbi:MAG: PAS domain S-box protein [Acidobacteria bacterium]|jgi:PAS domain S-box-containing protein|nr:PAS domain S-box protein [Acidobacteriota bacterium]